MSNFHIPKISSRVWLWTAKTSFGLAPLHFRILVDGVKTEISLGIKISPKDWDNKKGQVKKSNPQSVLYNAQISDMLAKYANAVLTLISSKAEHITALIIRDMMFGKEAKQKPLTVEELIKDFIQSMVKGKQHEATTIKRYQTQANSLLLFLERENKRSLKLENFNTDLMYQFQNFLLVDKKIQQVTASKYLKGIKTMFLYAISHGFINAIPFGAFKANREKKRPIVYLTPQEVEILENKVFETERLNQVKDFFLMQCYTSFAYTDLCDFKKDDVKIIEGESVIIKERMKTGTPQVIPFLPKAQAIMEKYNWQLPIKVNQKMNEYLKEIANICGFKIKLTTHIGRKTFITNAATLGVPIETISKIAGHSSVKMTLGVYAEITPTKLLKDFQLFKK